MPVLSNNPTSRFFTVPFDEYAERECLLCGEPATQGSLLLIFPDQLVVLHVGCTFDMLDMITHELRDLRDFHKANGTEMPEPKKEIREVLDWEQQRHAQKRRDEEETARAGFHLWLLKGEPEQTS